MASASFTISPAFPSAHLPPLGPPRLGCLRTTTGKGLAPVISGTTFKFCQLPNEQSNFFLGMRKECIPKAVRRMRKYVLIQNRAVRDQPPSLLILHDIMFSEAREDNKWDFCPGRKNLAMERDRPDLIKTLTFKWQKFNYCKTNKQEKLNTIVSVCVGLPLLISRYSAQRFL